MRIWLATEADLPAVGSLLAGFRDHFGKREPSDEEMLASATRILADGSSEFLLGALEEEPLGLAQLRFRWSVWTSSEDCWLEDLFVREEARRSGLGRALTEASIERARAHGCGRIELDVSEQNEPALALYAACGFNLEAKQPGRTLLAGRRL